MQDARVLCVTKGLKSARVSVILDENPVSPRGFLADLRKVCCGGTLTFHGEEIVPMPVIYITNSLNLREVEWEKLFV